MPPSIVADRFCFADTRPSVHKLLLIPRKIEHLTRSLAGQAVGVKKVDDGVWLVSFMEYDLGYVDLEEE
jgi:hypothetical protein